MHESSSLLKFQPHFSPAKNFSSKQDYLGQNSLEHDLRERILQNNAGSGYFEGV